MGCEHVRIVGSGAADLLPQIVFHAAKIELGFEHDPQALSLRIVVNAGQVECLQTVNVRILRRGLDSPLPPAKPNEVSDFELRDQGSRHCGQYAPRRSIGICLMKFVPTTSTHLGTWQPAAASP